MDFGYKHRLGKLWTKSVDRRLAMAALYMKEHGGDILPGPDEPALAKKAVRQKACEKWEALTSSVLCGAAVLDSL